MVEHLINLDKYGCPERGPVYPVKFEYPIPRTREAWEQKSFVYLELGNNRKVSFLTRKVEDFCLPTLTGFDFREKLSYSDTYTVAWKTLKERGFRVVPTVRKVDRNTVATTNLSADEVTSVYDQKIDAMEVRDTFPMDKEFVKIPVEKIQKEAETLLYLANHAGVELMSDGPFHIVVQGDANWYLSFLDIGKVRIHANPRDLSESAINNNQFYTNKAVMAFAKIQGNIKALRGARGLS
ncbi:hypothetical protein D4S03_11650 [bacterium]|nr:MAG: hypothetical protein D4S03_11650 [bacterium]